MNSLFLLFVVHFCIFFINTLLLYGHHKHCQSQKCHKEQSEKQIDIVSSPLYEITEAIASLPMIINIHPLLMYHGISQDNT